MSEKRVMVIVYYWPPLAGSGVQRWLKMTKYFTDFGVTPVIVTPENPYYSIRDESLEDDVNPHAEIIRLPIFEPYKIAEKLIGRKIDNTGKVKYDENTKLSIKDRFLKYARGKFFIPDPRIFWVRPTVRFLKNYLIDHPVDAVITTGPPHSMHLIGVELKRWNRELMFFADFRDPMTQLDFMQAFGVNGALAEKYKSIEKKIVNTADMVTATSPSMHMKLEEFDLSKFRSITNGYDEKDFQGKKENKSSEIVFFHAGLLNELRNPTHLWTALDEMIHEGYNIRLILAGTIDQGVLDSIKSHKHLDKKIRLLGYVNHSEVVQLYIDASVNILLINNSSNSMVNIPGKLFELLAAKKPILSIGASGSDAHHIIDDIEHTVSASYETDSSVLKDDIKKLLSSVEREVDYQLYERYERKSLTRDYLGLIYKDLKT